MTDLILFARNEEKKKLNELYNSDSPQLVAVYGCMRVGKTFLIDNTFADRITFRHAGLSPLDYSKTEEKEKTRTQIKHFYHSLIMAGIQKRKIPNDWFEAFYMLEDFLDSINDGSRQLIFIDELPWMDTPKSRFMSSFEAFWNSWACFHKNIMVVVCGSTTSWMLNKLVNNHGGLYGRVTCELNLQPFNMKQCEEYLLHKGMRFSKYDIAQTYMIFGGIPYYLNYLEKDKSLPQNIDNIFFSSTAKLKNEFDRLFASAFAHPEQLKRIIRALKTKRSGLTRAELINATKIESSGTLTEQLITLETSGFIKEYTPYSEGKRNSRYRLIDPFCLFYLQFIDKNNRLPNDFWKHNWTSKKISSWRGYAFENVCFNHIKQIKMALGIESIYSKEYALSFKGDDNVDGGQIDMIIERNDNIVDICELKFYSSVFVSDLKMHEKLQSRKDYVESHMPRKSTSRNVLITTYGLEDNEYSNDFDAVISLNSLFK